MVEIPNRKGYVSGFMLCNKVEMIAVCWTQVSGGKHYFLYLHFWCSKLIRRIDRFIFHIGRRVFEYLGSVNRELNESKDRKIFAHLVKAIE